MNKVDEVNRKPENKNLERFKSWFGCVAPINRKLRKISPNNTLILNLVGKEFPCLWNNVGVKATLAAREESL